MDIPDLVQQALGGEEIRTGVSLGDEDVVCFTSTRVLVYNGEGLISDEGVEELSLDTERLSIKRSRRKTKFTLQYIEGPESFTVPANRGEDVLERLLEGVLRVDGVLDDDESVAGVYLFSELTLVISDRRVVKHIGGPVWDEDFETYDFADVTGLDFEQTSVATSIVLGIDGRPQRVKVPSDNAPIVRQSLQEALFEFHDVASLDELNHVLGDDDQLDVDEGSAADDLTFGSGIDPLVTESDDDPAKGVEDPFAAGPTDDDAEAVPSGTADAVGTSDPTAVGATENTEDAPTELETASGSGDSLSGGPDFPESEETAPTAGATPDTGETAESDDRPTGPESADTDESTRATTDEPASDAGTGSTTGVGDTESPATDALASAASDGHADLPEGVATSEDVEAVADRLEELTDAVDRQNELLKRQHRAMKQLVERLDEE